MVRRPTVCIVTPYLADANNGNWHTASRWARLLRPAFRVQVATEWNGRPFDALIALHAGRSAASIDAFARAHPDRALIVVLTGTDLYGGLDATARRSLGLASRLVVLNELGRDALPAPLRSKAHVVLPSATTLPPLAPRHRTFDVAVVGHLRAVKDPQLPMRVARALPDHSKHPRAACRHVRWSAAGRARRGPRRAPPTTTAGSAALSGAEARALIRRARVLLHPSKEEGGATVIVEALQSGTPVIASACEGQCGPARTGLSRPVPGRRRRFGQGAAAARRKRARVLPRRCWPPRGAGPGSSPRPAKGDRCGASSIIR